MSNESTTQSGSTGFCGLLTIAFIILKLTRTIAWSWWWVLSPLLILLGIAAIFGIIYLIAAVIVEHRKA